MKIKLIAAGGVSHTTENGEKIMTDVVEIYKLGQWYSTKRLPCPMSSPYFTITDNTCYILGYFERSSFHNPTFFSTLSPLDENAVPEDPPT